MTREKKKKKSAASLSEEILTVVFFKGASNLTDHTMKFNISWSIVLLSAVTQDSFTE